MKTAALLLAAGHSRRFGAQNKLLADLNGKPLVVHAAQALQATGADDFVAVVRAPEVAALLDGFTLCLLPDSEPEQSASVRRGVERCQTLGAERVLIALGDMPFIAADHFAAVLSLCSIRHGSATVHKDRRMPPACFPEANFPDLLSLEGDEGAGRLLRLLPETALVPAADLLITDIDTPEDLEG